MKISLHTLLCATAAGLVAASLCSCAKTDMSNKEERNAIRYGNKSFEKNKFKDAIDNYSDALEANPQSDAAYYNRGLATLHWSEAKPEMLQQARTQLDSIGRLGSDPSVSERALYNMGCDAVYMGDYMLAASQALENEAFADSLKQLSTSAYKQAIDYYETLLRKKPNNIRAIQNLRIAQLKLPPEEQGGQSNNQNREQNQEQQQQQQQQQPQPQQQQNQNEKQVLQSIQAKENKTRKDQPAEPAARRSTDKPW